MCIFAANSIINNIHYSKINEKEILIQPPRNANVQRGVLGGD